MRHHQIKMEIWVGQAVMQEGKLPSATFRTDNEYGKITVLATQYGTFIN